MKIEITDLSPVKKTLDIEVDADEVARETEKVVQRYAATVRVPGFRPGKVPVGVIRARFQKDVLGDVRDRLISKWYVEATREKGLRPLGDPVLDQVAFEKEGPFRFKTTFEVVPDFAPHSYRDVSVRQPSATLGEGEVERTLEELRQSQVRLVAEEGRSAAVGDVIVADVEGTPEGGETFRREGVLIEVGSPGNLPEFNDRIQGVAPGAKLEFSVSYPKEFESRSLAGKAVLYRLAVHEVKRQEFPALDDEFARDLGDFESLEALRAKVRVDLGERKSAEARSAVRQGVLDKVLLENPIVLPDALVDEEIQHRLEDFVRAMVSQGVDPGKLKVDWKEIRDRQEAPARKAVHARLVLDAIAAAESIKAEGGEVDALVRREAERIGQAYDVVRARLSKAGGLEALQDQLVREKTLDFLVSLANIQLED